MNKWIALALMFAFLYASSGIFAQEKGTKQERVRQLRQTENQQRKAALRLAREKGWPISGKIQGRRFSLIRLLDGRPLYYIAHNVQAAISTNAAAIRSTAPWNVDGSGILVGVWDGGWVRDTHQELAGRVTEGDTGASVDGHATHVAGTIAASGVDSEALGMAPAATIRTFDWNNDFSEMTSQAAQTPADATGMFLSNHSYGVAAGYQYLDMENGQTAWFWYGESLTVNEDRKFGLYSSQDASVDSVVEQNPYYLPIYSSGNDRDEIPQDGDLIYYLNEQGQEVSKNYNAASDPPGDGVPEDGYDTIPTGAIAKNILTVGAVGDAVSGSARSLANATMTAFSSWGPADDGRIKPDVVGNGASVYSAYGGSDTDYTSMDGTSMAAPNVAGSAALLVELYRSLLASAMRASTLKALLIHTADDLGNEGPDYRFGWGLINVLAAAELIQEHADNSDRNYIYEGIVDSTDQVYSFSFNYSGSGPVKCTLCWTDPAGNPRTNLDDSTPALVNDLDLRLLSGGTYEPWVLDPANPSQAAQTGDNTLDNVEQVYLANPPSGSFTVQVSFKSFLDGGSQRFSLILTGQGTITEPDDGELSISPSTGFTAYGEEGGPFTPNSQSYSLTNTGNVSLDWTASINQNWLTLSPTAGTLNPNASDVVTLSLNGAAESLTPGTYQDTLVFQDATNGNSVNRSVLLEISGGGGGSGEVTSFDWSTIASPQQTDTPFTVTITARDSSGNVAANFNGTVSLSVASQRGVSASEYGSGTSIKSLPFKTSFEDCRCQMIYPSSALGERNAFGTLAFNVHTPGRTMRNCRIRMQHTQQANYGQSALWVGDGWTQVFQGDIYVSQAGWHTIPFQTPFEYNGSDNVMVDFFFDDDGYSVDSYVYFTETATAQTLFFFSDSNHGDPRSWIGQVPIPKEGNWLPNIRLEPWVDANNYGLVQIRPTTAGPFSLGLWRGSLEALNPGEEVVLRAKDLAGHQGDSNPFNVYTPEQLNQQGNRQAQVTSWELY